MSRRNTEFSLSDSIDKLENRIRSFKTQKYTRPPDIIKYQNQLGKMINQRAEQELQSENYELSYQYIQKAIELSKFIPELKFQTLNNLALYYQKIQKPQIALGYLEKVLKLQFNKKQQDNIPNTYLNISAIQSSLNQHEEAIQSIYLSIILLQHDLLIDCLKQNMELQTKLSCEKQSNLIAGYLTENIDEYIKIDRAQVLIAAYHNLSLEMKHLEKNQEAQRIIESAHILSQYVLQPSHDLRIKLKNLSDQIKLKKQTLDKRSISFDDRTKLNRKKNNQPKESYSQLITINPLKKLYNTPQKLKQHTRFITEITNSANKNEIFK